MFETSAKELEKQILTFDISRYRVRVANDKKSRENAYRLVYELYREKCFAKDSPSCLWLSIFDALPETTTLIAEHIDTGILVGALTVILDSPIGLPADNLYRAEIDAHRAMGRAPSEIISLGVRKDIQGQLKILIKLFNHAYLIAHKIYGSSDFIITVNPSHVAFYRKKLLFNEVGPERYYEKVGGAPAKLLHLDMSVISSHVSLEHGPKENRPPKSPTLFKSSYAPSLEPAIIEAHSQSLCPMSVSEFHYFFIEKTSALADASAEQRAYIKRIYGFISEDHDKDLLLPCTSRRIPTLA